MLSASTDSRAVCIFGFEVDWLTALAAAIATTALVAFLDQSLALAATGLARSGRATAGVAALAGDARVQTGVIGAAAAWAWNARRIARDAAAREWATLQLRRVLFVAAAVILAAALEETSHLVLSRQRPSVFLATGENVFYPFGFRIFGKWGSFPSGHAARVFAAAAAAWMAWGRWRGALIALALSASLSRVPLAQHFASDVIAGAWLGLAAASALRWSGAVARWDRRGVATVPG